MVKTCKSLLLWRYHLCYKNKQIILCLLIVFVSFGLFSQDEIGYYWMINQITGPDNSELLIRNVENAVDLRLKGDKVFPGEKILTGEKQKAELILYKENTPVVMLFMNEITDVECSVEKGFASLSVMLGRVRMVTAEGHQLPVRLNSINIVNKGTDFGFISSINEETSTYKGYIIVFDGEVEAATEETGISVNTFTRVTFSGTEFESQGYFSRKDFLLWKETMTTTSEFVPNNLNLVLENLDAVSMYQMIVQMEQEKEKTGPLPEITVEADATTDMAVDETSDRMAAAGDVVKRFFLSFLNIELGATYYKNNVDVTDSETYFDYNRFAVKLASRPGLSLLHDNLEFRLNLSFHILPTHILLMRPFMNVNEDNNEWSMGTDHSGQTHRIVFDVFNDLFLKLHLLRYGFEESRIFVKAGDIYNYSDDYDFSLIDFNSSIFKPIKRSTSLTTRFKLRFFESHIYAEDVLPKGLYGASFSFFTPSRSFRIKGGMSTYFDLYDFRQYIYGNLEEEIFIPGSFAGHLKFTVFDVPSFGLVLYWNGGVLVPFSYNTAEGTYGLTEMISANSTALGSCLAFNSGVSTRFRRVTLSGEVTVDSDINKVGLFDPLYVTRRGNRNTIYSNWLSAMGERAPGIGDILFGMRVKLQYEKDKRVFFKMLYQIGATYDDSQIIPVGLYDKFSFILRLDSTDKWKVHVASDIELHIEEMGLRGYELAVDQNYSNLFRSIAFYTGLHITPRPGLTFHTRFGMYPSYVDQTSSFKALLEAYISYNPEFDFKIFRKAPPDSVNAGETL